MPGLDVGMMCDAAVVGISHAEFISVGAPLRRRACRCLEGARVLLAYGVYPGGRRKRVAALPELSRTLRSGRLIAGGQWIRTPLTTREPGHRAASRRRPESQLMANQATLTLFDTVLFRWMVNDPDDPVARVTPCTNTPATLP